MAAQGTTLLVMDESDSRETDVFALVGLAVPIEKADTIRLSLHSLLRELEAPPETHITQPPELHGSNLLPLEKVPWATDEHRIRCYEHVVDLVREHRLQVLRAAYYKRSLYPPMILEKHPEQRDNWRYGLCFSGLERFAAALLSDSYVLPIMDGVTIKFAALFGASKPLFHAMRVAPNFREASLGIDNAKNLMDPVFVDSRYSSLMQVADMTAHLLHILDWERAGLPLKGEYKPRVAAAARKLDMSLVFGAEPITMQHG